MMSSRTNIEHCRGNVRLAGHWSFRLCVHPDWQQRGAGRHLMDFAEAFAKEHGFSCIRLDAYTGNQRALALYEKRGYDRIGQAHFPRRELPFVCFEKIVE